MTDEQERALYEFRMASKAIAAAPGFRGGAGAEKTYAQTYHRCAKLGLYMPLKKKYR